MPTATSPTTTCSACSGRGWLLVRGWRRSARHARPHGYLDRLADRFSPLRRIVECGFCAGTGTVVDVLDALSQLERRVQILERREQRDAA
jgi:hypothetical protein